MKIRVCDICYKKDKKLVRAERTTTIKGLGKISVLDYCNECKDKIPKDTTKYLQFIYELEGIKLSEEQAKKMLKRG